MDILLYKDGHLSISESPLQGKENNLDDVVMLVSNPQEGDTLTYKGGKWINGEGGGGSGGDAMVLTLTKTTEDEVEIYTLGATYAQVKAALRAGIEAFFVDDMETDVMKYTLNGCSDGGTDDYNYAYFSAGSNGMDFKAAAEDDQLTFKMG